MIVAYLDPNAGSMAIQMIIAAVVAVPFFLRTHIARGVERIRGRREHVNDDRTDPAA